MNRLTLRHRLLILTLLPSMLISIALVTYFTLSSIRGLENELRNKGLSTVRYLAPISEYGLISGQTENLYALAQITVQESGVKAILIANQNGRAIAVSGRISLGNEILHKTLNKPMQVTETEQWMGFGAPVMRSINDADPLFEVPGTAKKTSPPEIIGHVFIELDKTELIRQQSELTQRGLLIVLIGLILLAALAIAIADNLAKPIIRLARAISDISTGKLETRVPHSSSGEIGILENGFNTMAHHIEEAQSSLQSRIEEATAELAYQAHHDALTGLLNRREFEYRLEKELSNIKTGSENSSILFLDLDRFKPVNDICGHLAGDELLRQISQLFQSRLREEDTLARLGGDEFGIILSKCNSQRAMLIANDICALSAAYRFIWQDKVFAIGTSIGITEINRRVNDINEIIAAGDAGCSQAKESGRNQVCERAAFNTPERRHENQSWANRITAALAENRLQIEALPIGSLENPTQRHNIVELTARLIEPGQAPTALSALIDAAERDDLATLIDLRLLEVAINALTRAHHLGKTLSCLVPLSSSALTQQAITEYIGQHLINQNIPGNGLCLMFSEEISTQQGSQAIQFSQQIRALGCQICLDNFGSSLSSFSHLRNLSPRYVKLSRSLTRDIHGNRASTALLRAVQEITSDQDIESISDNIDDSAAIEQLKTFGINYAQGKAIAPCEPFEVWLEGVAFRTS